MELDSDTFPIKVIEYSLDDSFEICLDKKSYLNLVCHFYYHLGTAYSWKWPKPLELEWA